MIDISLDQAKSEMINAVNQIMSEHKLTPGVMSLILDAVNGELCRLKGTEYANELIRASQPSQKSSEAVDSKQMAPTSKVITENVTPEELIKNVEASGEKNPMLIDEHGKQITLEEYKKRIKDKYDNESENQC